jgi:hypothetical protein
MYYDNKACASFVINISKALKVDSLMHQGELARMQDAFDSTNLCVLGILMTRCLSCHGSIARICEAFEPLIRTLQLQTDVTTIGGLARVAIVDNFCIML